jgi:hypothetical protein
VQTLIEGTMAKQLFNSLKEQLQYRLNDAALNHAVLINQALFITKAAWRLWSE